ncbi:hypothetical protein A1O3_08622 [Capronia epimyces CBS 606.96]|uniref:Uncharacterized protein n=1 Tax=Capronia epimyces CBS 606.96 TaxID=1182542 RepID=W9XQ59_9EURO|nr:uncharacterized protein A1O3_08622 [Capronia epimyces CBS 606.96]EXJ79121.1 hypothetical protein A1O3_08622 [Capronia epimyces CBS 606.96]
MVVHTRFWGVIKKDLTTIKDRRVVSGRILILPQPSLSLNALIQQLFSTVDKDELESIISKDEQEHLTKNVLRLPFLSAPLSGLTDHLVTLAQGTHINPSVRASGQGPGQPITEAVDQGPNPQPRSSAATSPVQDGMAPCLGEFYEVSSKTPVAGASAATTTTVAAHTAGKDDVNGLSEFIQPPPSINQPALLNAHFVKRESATDPKSGWRPTTEWEDPIWGWIVVNYIDYGIQLFTAQGIFYREVRLPGRGAGGQTRADASTKWLPFKKTEQQPDSTAQLDKLITQLTAEDGVYLQAFLDMINGALKQSGPAPGEYAEALNCIVGRPLALVNMDNSDADNSDADNSDADDSYRFPIKLGDSHREYDGLVGYFPQIDRSKSTNPPDDGNLPLNDEFDLTKLYTYFGLDQKPDVPGVTPALHQAPAASYARASNDALQVFAAILDPFQPIHGSSSFLSIKELKLLDWTWQQALNHMAAFLHMGPADGDEGRAGL